MFTRVAMQHGAELQAVEAREKLGGDLVLRAGAPAGGGQAAGTAGASWHGQIFVRLNQDGGAQVRDARDRT
jgi:hypothetical protein